MITALTLTGLIANMMGVAIAFVYGYPQPSHEASVGLVVSDATVFSNGEKASEINEKTKRRESHFRLRSKLGLGLMFLGFALQLVAVCLDT